MRPRPVTLGVFVTLGCLVSVGVFAPERAETTTERVVEGLEAAPEPVTVVGSALLVTAAGVAVAVGLARLLYRPLCHLTGGLLRLRDTLLPESVIVRFGVGFTMMVLLFLIGPLVAIQAFDIGPSEDSVEQQVTDGAEPTDDRADTNRTNATEPHGPTAGDTGGENASADRIG